MSILALIVGVVTGFGAILFRNLIGLIHNAGFLGQFAVRYDANRFTPAKSMGSTGHSCAGCRRFGRYISHHEVCTGGSWSWRTGSDGCDLLQGRRDSARLWRW